MALSLEPGNYGGFLSNDGCDAESRCIDSVVWSSGDRVWTVV
jgi:hypothetical protein